MPYFEKSDYPELPEDTPLLCEITGAELVHGTVYGSSDPQDQVRVTFEVAEGALTGAKLQRWAKAVFSPKSTLAKIAAAAFADESLPGFDTNDLIGRQLYVIGDFGEDGKLGFLRPRKFKPAVRTESNGRPRRPASAASTAPAPRTGGSGAADPEPEAERRVPVTGTGSPPADDGLDF